MPEPLTERQLAILWHSLGMNFGNARRSLAWWLDEDNHRNHYCATLAYLPAIELLESLVARGLMMRGRRINDGRDRYYHATEDGIRSAWEQFPRSARWRT